MNLVEKIKALLLKMEEEGLCTKEDYILNESQLLSALTTFHTGGPATVLYPKTKDFLISFYPRLLKENIPFFVLGFGSNVIAKDEGYDGLILSLTRLSETRVEENKVFADCGASFTALSTLAQKNALSGMETFFGIPGTVGGAVFMNAGAYGGECADVLVSVTYLTREGKVETLSREEAKMGYRTSVFQENGGLILSAQFQLTPGDPDEIRAKMDDFMERRKSKQPLNYPSAGSTFKRLDGHFTAQMIDEAGLKGKSVGGAMVSEKHAGFVINYDNATSADIFALIDFVKKKIYEKNGLNIECEVRVIE